VELLNAPRYILMAGESGIPGAAASGTGKGALYAAKAQVPTWECLTASGYGALYRQAFRVWKFQCR
jgi:hypothetical protein